jgi:hypothetical protein
MAGSSGPQRRLLFDDQSRRGCYRLDPAAGVDGDVEPFSRDGECADGKWACRSEVDAACGTSGSRPVVPVMRATAAAADRPCGRQAAGEGAGTGVSVRASPPQSSGSQWSNAGTAAGISTASATGPVLNGRPVDGCPSSATIKGDKESTPRHRRPGHVCAVPALYGPWVLASTLKAAAQSASDTLDHLLSRRSEGWELPRAPHDSKPTSSGFSPFRQS